MLPLLPALILLILQGPSDFERLARINGLEGTQRRVEAPLAAVLRYCGIAVLELQAPQRRNTVTPQYRNTAPPALTLGSPQDPSSDGARPRDGPRAA